MRFLRGLAKLIGAVLLVLVLAFGAVLVGARWHDGPMGMIAGGPLVAGDLAIGAEPDWKFAHDIPTVEFQLLNPARSRTTWILEVDGHIYIPSGYMNSAIGKLWKQWPLEAAKDGRAILRINGRRYERSLVRVQSGAENAALLQKLLDEVNRKYGTKATMANVANGAMWLFELAPRVGS